MALRTVRTFRSTPTWLLMPRLVRAMMVKSFLPVMPVMNRWGSELPSKRSWIMVPGSSGALVLRMFKGMFFSRTGKMVPS